MKNERKIIRDLASILGLGECIDYDACPFNDKIIVNMDGYALEYSKYPFLTLEDWGYRSIAAAVSDVIASGGTPKAVLYSVGVRSRDEAQAIAIGISEAVRKLGLKVLKSDLNRATRPWIDVAVLGVTERPVSRAGAGPGDLVIQAGYLGYGLVEYLVFKGKIPLHEAWNIVGFARRLPPRIEKVIMRYATASSDNSDGWSATLWNIAYSSNVSIHLDDFIIDPQVRGLLEKYRVKLEAGLTSWEDYNIAFTVKAEDAVRVLDECKALGVNCWIVGRVGEGPARVEYRGRELAYGWEWL